MANTKAKKVVKEVKNFDFSKVVDRVKEGATDLRNMDLSKVVDKVKEGATDVNEFMLENSEELVKETVVRGEQWQDVAAKAVKGGLKLTANTQDMVFDTLDTLKDQIIDGRSRVKNLFSRN